jgi:hypothetical protein
MELYCQNPLQLDEKENCIVTIDNIYSECVLSKFPGKNTLTRMN